MSEFKSTRPFALTERYIRAGTDPDGMLPMLIVEDLSELGIDGVPDLHLLLSPEAARKVAAALLFAADPDLAVRMLERLYPPAASVPATTFGNLSEVASFRAGMLAKGSTAEGADWIMGIGPKVRAEGGRCIDPNLPPEPEGQ